MTVSFRNSDGCRWNRSDADTSTACESPEGGYSAARGEASAQAARSGYAREAQTFHASEALRQRLRGGGGGAHRARAAHGLCDRLVLGVRVVIAVSQQVDVHGLRGNRRAQRQAHTPALVWRERRTSAGCFFFFGSPCFDFFIAWSNGVCDETVALGQQAQTDAAGLGPHLLLSRSTLGKPSLIEFALAVVAHGQV